MCLRFVEMGRTVQRGVSKPAPFYIHTYSILVLYYALYNIHFTGGSLSFLVPGLRVGCRRVVVILRPFWTGATSASGLLFGLDVNRAWNPSRGPSSLSFYYLLTRYDSPNSPRRRRMCCSGGCCRRRPSTTHSWEKNWKWASHLIFVVIQWKR